jgi:hypothetical protein
MERLRQACRDADDAVLVHLRQHRSQLYPQSS